MEFEMSDTVSISYITAFENDDEYNVWLLQEVFHFGGAAFISSGCSGFHDPPWDFVFIKGVLRHSATQVEGFFSKCHCCTISFHYWPDMLFTIAGIGSVFSTDAEAILFGNGIESQ